MSFEILYRVHSKTVSRDERSRRVYCTVRYKWYVPYFMNIII